MALYSNFQLRIRGPQGTHFFPLLQGRTILGRASDCNWVFSDQIISEHHAQIDYDAQKNRFVLTDLNSEHGTYWNDPTCEESISDEIPLKVGDEIRLGKGTSYTIYFEESSAKPIEHPRDVERPSLYMDPYAGIKPPGVETESLHLLQFLPEIYRSDAFGIFQSRAPSQPSEQAPLLSRFLALFESVLLPSKWQIENFDFFLDPKLSPITFYPWLESWFGTLPNVGLREEQRLAMLLEVHEIFTYKGTAMSLQKAIKLCTGLDATIDDKSLPGSAFRVTIQANVDKSVEQILHDLIVALKPVHTTYELVTKAQ